MSLLQVLLCMKVADVVDIETHVQSLSVMEQCCVALVTDNASNMVKVRKRVLQKLPHVIEFR